MKASVLLGAGWEDDSLHVLWRDADRAFCRLWRNDAETHAFIPIPSGAEHPTLESINRLIREYELKDDFAADWALRPVELLRERGRTMLVVEYTGGEPLARLVGPPMEVGRFLRLGVALSAAVGRLHERGDRGVRLLGNRPRAWSARAHAPIPAAALPRNHPGNSEGRVRV